MRSFIHFSSIFHSFVYAPFHWPVPFHSHSFTRLLPFYPIVIVLLVFGKQPCLSDIIITIIIKFVANVNPCLSLTDSHISNFSLQTFYLEYVLKSKVVCFQVRLITFQADGLLSKDACLPFGENGGCLSVTLCRYGLTAGDTNRFIVVYLKLSGCISACNLGTLHLTSVLAFPLTHLPMFPPRFIHVSLCSLSF